MNTHTNTRTRIQRVNRKVYRQMSKEGIIHDWNYQKELLHLFGDDEDFKFKTLNLLQKIYERAVKEFGYNWAEANLPKD